MKAKACTKCRQWKVKCDYNEGGDACTRCHSLNLPCVFDTRFKRTSKTKSIERMSSEIRRLQQALDEAYSNSSSSNHIAEPNDGTLVSTDWTSQAPILQNGMAGSSSSVSAFCQTGTGAQPAGSGETLNSPYRTIDNAVTLSRGQVNEHFRNYFARYHHHLPFTFTSRSPEAIYSKCPLLFWVICAAAASWTLRSRLAPSVKNMLADTIHSSPRSIEKVQALLIMSTWPFSVTATLQDASDFYCGLATQMALHLGLHRPNQSHLHQLGSEEHLNSRTANYEVKITTWLACFVVSQRQAQIRGVPQSICVDIHLLNAFGNKVVDPRLSQMCRIYHVLMQANIAIGTEAVTPSGMLEPAARVDAIELWVKRFSTIQEQYLKQMDDVVKIAFLSSRVQVCSFALLNDMPISTEMLDCVESAKQDSYALIELCYSQNLAMAPAHVRHATSYSGFVLIKILRSGFSTEPEVLQDNIERVRQALSTIANAPDDTYRKACQRMQSLIYLEDRKLLPPIYTRMGASLKYDLMRICAEHKYGPSVELDEQRIDLEGFDWNFLECVAQP